MSELFSISAVDRRKDVAQVHKTAQSNVAHASPGNGLTANDETQNEADRQKHSGRRPPDEEDRNVPGEDPDAHNCDVTV